MEREECIASRVGRIPTLPAAAREILTLLRHSGTTLDDLDDVLLLDEELGADVLRMANSAFFRRREPLADLREAIVILGAESLGSLVGAAACRRLYRSHGPRMGRLLIWEHAVATGLAAQQILMGNEAGTEEAFLAGLVHDIGKAVLDENLGSEYQSVIDRVHDEQISFLQAETETLQFNHADVGSLVAKSWNLSPRIEEAIRLHHEPTRAGIDAEFCAAVSLANCLCVKLGIGPEARPLMDLERLDARRMLNLEPERLAWIAKGLPATMRESGDRFGIEGSAIITAEHHARRKGGRAPE